MSSTTRSIAQPSPRFGTNRQVSASTNNGEGPSRKAAQQETFQERNRRVEAAYILESYEKLVWHAMMRNESLVQTRLHFENIVAGFTADDKKPDWIEDFSPIHEPEDDGRGDGRSTPRSTKKDGGRDKGKTGADTPGSASKRKDKHRKSAGGAGH